MANCHVRPLQTKKLFTFSNSVSMLYGCCLISTEDVLGCGRFDLRAIIRAAQLILFLTIHHSAIVDIVTRNLHSATGIITYVVKVYIYIYNIIKTQH